DRQRADCVITVDRGVPGLEGFRELHRSGGDDLEVLGPAPSGRRQGPGGDLDHPRRRQRSESERLREGLPRTAGLNSGTQVETFERGAARLSADGVEELTPL